MSELLITEGLILPEIRQPSESGSDSGLSIVVQALTNIIREHLDQEESVLQSAKQSKQAA